jgi:hypothetical protein
LVLLIKSECCKIEFSYSKIKGGYQKKRTVLLKNCGGGGGGGGGW